MNKEELIRDLKSKVDDSKAAGEPYTDTSWGNQHGVLISTKQADEIINILSNTNIEEVIKSLTKEQQDAIKVFIEVCNEPLPEGNGKEYLNAMIKMKAFMAGRCFEFQKRDKEYKHVEKTKESINVIIEQILCDSNGSSRGDIVSFLNKLIEKGYINM